MILAAVIVTSSSQWAIAADGKARPKQRSRIVNPANAFERVNDAADTGNLNPGSAGVRVIRAQILTDRAHFSPGEIDGKCGPDLEIAVRQRQPQPHHRGAAHRTPHREIQVVVAHGGAIPGGRPQAGDDQQAAAVRHQRRYHVAPVQRHWLDCSWKLLMPISVWEISTAAAQ